LIKTPNGNVRISKIKQGDFVYNSFGIDKVLKSGKTKVAEIQEYTIIFSNFKVKIKCTKDHLFYTDKGWKEISKVKKGNQVFLNKYLTVCHLGYTQKKDTTHVEMSECTDTYGSIIMGKYRMVMTFITKMKTHITTTLKTSKWCKSANIWQNTGNNGQSIIRNGLNYFKQTELQKHPNGIKARPGMNGINSTQKITTSDKILTELDNATCAKIALRLKQIRKGFVQTNVNQSSDATREPITSNQYALSAKKNLHIPNTIKESPVQGYVVQNIEIENIGFWNVYDLTIENHPEYFANGMLVHNSVDAIRYSLSLGLHDRKSVSLDGVFF
jgi:hypothetical protein